MTRTIIDPVIIGDPTRAWWHVSIPKVACTSIRRALESHLCSDVAENVHDRPWPATLSVERLRWTSAYVWAVVRNPFDRLVSVWADKCRPPAAERLSPQFLPFVGRSFPDFCLEACRLVESDPNPDHHIRPMVDFLYATPPHVRIIDIGGLHAAWETALSPMFGLPSLPCLNATEHWQWQLYFTPETIRRVEAAYGDDLAQWWPGVCK